MRLMVQRIAVWHGTDQQLYDLQEAVEHNCQCDAEHQITCQPHTMLGDQSTLDHLAFVIRNRMAYYHAEFDPPAEWF